MKEMIYRQDAKRAKNCKKASAFLGVLGVLAVKVFSWSWLCPTTC
jgi:hypothetical protein